MDVAVEPAIERAKLGARQDEGPGYPSSLQESVQIIHHPGRQQYSSVSALKPGHSKNWATRFIYSDRWDRDLQHYR